MREGCRARAEGRAADGDAFSVAHAAGRANRIRSETEGGAPDRAGAVAPYPTRRLETEVTDARNSRWGSGMSNRRVRVPRSTGISGHRQDGDTGLDRQLYRLRRAAS